ncbi:MAG: hypothetical protein M9958_08705 [Chitinophagales bacterium]|nr:hypothetical protein [Chitinophagales bacterium]
MIQKVTTYLLFSLMLFCTTKNAVLLTIYDIDQETFIHLFCVNQSNPEMECNGKCQLSHIAEEQGQNNDATQTLIELQKEVFFYYEASKSIPITPFIEEQQLLVHNSQPIATYNYLFSSSQKRPPQFLSDSKTNNYLLS